MSGRQLGMHTKFSQSTISRMLRDELAISPDAAERIAHALDLPQPEVRELVAMAEEITEQQGAVTPIRVMLQRGGVVSIQRRIRLRERNVTALKVYHPSVVPGILQTPAYIAAVMGLVAAEGELQPAVEERLSRQREAATRQIHFIITEGCLMQGAPEPGLMVEQCDHLARIATTHNYWRLGIIPRLHQRPELNVVQNGFDIYDDQQVFIGTTAGNTLTKDKPTVADHVARFEQLAGMAVYGDEARAVLQRMARLYRRG